jgi:heat shock protein HslJ
VRPSLVASLLTLALVAGGCGGGGASSESSAALNGAWVLTSGTTPDGEVEVGDGVEVTLTVDGTSWGGQVCNSYGAQDVEVGDDGSVAIGDVPRTEMACLDDRLMTAEDRYLAAFVAVTAYEVTTDELRLTGDGIELVYAPVASEPDAELVGTVWVLDTVIDGDGPDGTASSVVGDEATLELHDDGSYTFGTGCNTGGGRYELDGDRLVFPQGASGASEQGCEGQLGVQEEHVYAVLTDTSADVHLEGQRLTLTAGDRGLAYTAAG